MARGDTREVVEKELLLSNPSFRFLYFVVAVFLNFEGRGGVDVHRLIIIV